jgi:hypothetical protein
MLWQRFISIFSSQTSSKLTCIFDLYDGVTTRGFSSPQQAPYGQRNLTVRMYVVLCQNYQKQLQSNHSHNRLSCVDVGCNNCHSVYPWPLATFGSLRGSLGVTVVVTHSLDIVCDNVVEWFAMMMHQQPITSWLRPQTVLQPPTSCPELQY